jgi:hypothetical protein
MWYVLQGSIIFGVVCWIGQFVPLHEGHNARAAAMYGGIAAFAVTYAIIYTADFCRRLRDRHTRPQPPTPPAWKPKTGRDLVREYQTARRH